MGCTFADPSVYPLIFNPNNPKRKLRYTLDKRSLSHLVKLLLRQLPQSNQGHIADSSWFAQNVVAAYIVTNVNMLHLMSLMSNQAQCVLTEQLAMLCLKRFKILVFNKKRSF